MMKTGNILKYTTVIYTKGGDSLFSLFKNVNFGVRETAQ